MKSFSPLKMTEFKTTPTFHYELNEDESNFEDLKLLDQVAKEIFDSDLRRMSQENLRSIKIIYLFNFFMIIFIVLTLIFVFK